ncbi:CCDC174 family protein [Aspergillus ruber CBS 135680]|uniref:Coiled-coil domain-containing protein n=1 Tax=Aspergillus ruber (strain CBS 135680) TaxID=1388766 RepID=A0A017SD21_ASPRC|nr:uncharacterized protein EURHEDRAFT_413047 [Aspergillus ruber CBS 135680]EYE94686.1 hypothetical protein EURHEDRAFT_413047 [Aspergillus ruber CBS 135680]
MASNNSLYGNPPQKHPQSTNPQSSSSLAFTSHLSSLISQHQSSSTTGRARPSKSSKSDIFSVSNRGSQKRAAADLLDDNNGQQHKSVKDIGKVDEATLHRSKRRMEEKARLYEDLKKGDYLAGDSDDEDDSVGGVDEGRSGGDVYMARLRRKEKEGLVDFDRKWADEERKREDKYEEEEDGDDNASIISYEDDLGRTRHGTRAEAARVLAESQSQQEAAERWRPQRPTNLIYGEAIQTQAFNPDANTASQMSYLAARRDRSPTPPEETHYDPEGEVRNRGTGFYAFSKDENVRKQQMEELMEARDETIKERDARRERRAERERLKDERRMKIEELRVKRRAEVFLAGLGDLGVQS